MFTLGLGGGAFFSERFLVRMEPPSEASDRQAQEQKARSSDNEQDLDPLGHDFSFSVRRDEPHDARDTERRVHRLCATVKCQQVSVDADEVPGPTVRVMSATFSEQEKLADSDASPCREPTQLASWTLSFRPGGRRTYVGARNGIRWSFA